MALAELRRRSQVAALLRAHARASWNRTLAESGLLGGGATVAALAMVAAVLLIPGAMTAIIGHTLGREIAAGAHDAVLHWASLQALFTFAFPLLGGVRQRLAFPREVVGPYPVGASTLLAAEVPAATFEVFPLLGGSAVVASHLGLAVALPQLLWLVPVLVIQGLAWLVLATVAAGALFRLALRRVPVVGVAAGLCGAVVVGIIVTGQGAATVRALTVDLILILPSAEAARGLVGVAVGAWIAGLGHLAVAFAATAALAVVAAWLGRRELLAPPVTARRRTLADVDLHHPNRVRVVARLFERQFLATQAGRIHLVVPALLGGSLAVFLGAMATIEGRGDTLPEDLSQILAVVADKPLVAIMLVIVVWFGVEIWANQFGWGGRDLPTLLALPVTTEELLAARLAAIARVAAAQASLAVLPLFLVVRPHPVEVVAGVSGAASLLVVMVAAGHLFSARFPRLILDRGSSTMPLYLGWIPSLVTIVLSVCGAAIARLASLVHPWAPAVVMPLLLGLVVLAYRRSLPRIATLVNTQRERLLNL